MLHDVTVETKRRLERALVLPVPPEEFGISRRARSIRDTDYCFHDVFRTQSKLIDATVNRKDRVLNAQNKRHGVAPRRGDGTFGEIIPGESPLTDAGYLVCRPG